MKSSQLSTLFSYLTSSIYTYIYIYTDLRRCTPLTELNTTCMRHCQTKTHNEKCDRRKNNIAVYMYNWLTITTASTCHQLPRQTPFPCYMPVDCRLVTDRRVQPRRRIVSRYCQFANHAYHLYSHWDDAPFAIPVDYNMSMVTERFGVEADAVFIAVPVLTLQSRPQGGRWWNRSAVFTVLEVVRSIW